MRNAKMSDLERELMSRPPPPPRKKPMSGADAAALLRGSGVKRLAEESADAPVRKRSRLDADEGDSASHSAAPPPAPPAAPAERTLPDATPIGGKRKAEDEPAKKAAKKAMFAKEKLLCSDGNASKRDEDEKAMRYLETLQTGANNVPGILAINDVNGEPLIPYSHQRQAVRKAAGQGVSFMLLAHDAGTGKTATFFQLLAALELLVKGGARAIVTVPSSTLDQWEETAHSWLNFTHKGMRIVSTNKVKDVDAMMLQRVRVLIISRTLLAMLYKENWQWQKKCEGQKKGMWVRKTDPKTGEVLPLHQFWKERWDLMGADEAYAALLSNPTPCPLIPHNSMRQQVSPRPRPQRSHTD